MSKAAKSSYKNVVTYEVKTNVSDNIVVTTDSKAKIIYRDFLARRIGFGTFFSFLGLFVSTLITVLTSTFNEVPNMPNSSFVMKGVFVCLCAVFGIISLISLIISIIGFKKYNEKSFIRALHEDDEN